MDTKAFDAGSSRGQESIPTNDPQIGWLQMNKNRMEQRDAKPKA